MPNRTKNNFNKQGGYDGTLMSPNEKPLNYCLDKSSDIDLIYLLRLMGHAYGLQADYKCKEAIKAYLKLP
jgi:hypothetical protein